MCIALLAIEVHPRYPLVIIANRDEFYQRPTQPMHWWGSDPDILAGRDLSRGGTWFGLNKIHQLALITNYREPHHEKSSGASRGELAADYLQHRYPAFEAHLRQSKDSYAGYNLIFGEGTSLKHYNNRTDRMTKLSPGVHGLSNATLDTPWPKVERGTTMLANALEDDEIEVEKLFQVLADRTRAPDEELPSTGIPLQLERELSSIRIETPRGYGSRSATVLLGEGAGRLRVWERDYSSGKTRAFTSSGKRDL